MVVMHRCVGVHSVLCVACSHTPTYECHQHNHSALPTPTHPQPPTHPTPQLDPAAIHGLVQLLTDPDVLDAVHVAFCHGGLCFRKVVMRAVQQQWVHQVCMWGVYMWCVYIWCVCVYTTLWH